MICEWDHPPICPRCDALMWGEGRSGIGKERQRCRTCGHVNLTRAEQGTMLREAIRRSGLSARQYAKQILVRDERTIRRWLSGESPIPDAVVRFLEQTTQRTK